MVSTESYDTLISIKNKVKYDSGAVHVLYSVFKLETKRELKISCPSCVREMINWANGAIQEYELNR